LTCHQQLTNLGKTGRAKDQIKILKYLLPDKIIGKTRNNSKVESVPIPTTIPYIKKHSKVE
jgi:hypothetical protein